MEKLEKKHPEEIGKLYMEKKCGKNVAKVVVETLSLENGNTANWFC